MRVIIYNGVAMPYPSLQDFRCEPVYDNVSGNDLLYSRCTASWTAVIAENFVTVSPTAAEPKPPGPSRQINNGPGGSHPTQMTGLGYRLAREGGPRSWPDTQVRPPSLSATPATPADIPILGFGTTPQGASQTGRRGVLPPELGLFAPPAESKRLYRIDSQDSKAAVTLAAVRHRLQQPRGEFWWFNGAGADADVLFRAPADGCRCDPAGGPKPRLLGIDAAVGDGQMLVCGFQIEFAVIEAGENGVPLLDPKALLSNQFKQTHAIDPAGYTTIHTEGEAVFRADFVLLHRENPDAFRPTFFLPQPNWAVRENIVTESIPGHLGVRYAYDDRQTSGYFPAGVHVKAAGISIRHRQSIVSDGDVLEGALTVYERQLGVRVNRRFAQDERAARRRRRASNGAAPGGPGAP